MSVRDLWLRYFSLGGAAGATELEAYLQGIMPLPAVERDILTHSINELLAECGQQEFLSYSFDIRPGEPDPSE